jgi:hypothetical protein
MARKRMIDPSFWIDEKLGTVEPFVRLLFMGLISQADDEGRLNGHPALIKSLIFPYDHEITIESVESWLVLLSSPDRKLIVRYEVDHQKYILIPNFKKHQTINKPQKSKLPEPLNDNYGSPTVAVDELSDNDTAQKKLKEEKLREGEEKGKETRPTDSNPHKDHIHKLINECKIQQYTIYDLDIIYSYVGVVELEVIEAAIKKGSNKQHINYAIRTLEGMMKDGITKADHLPKGGQAYAEHGGILKGIQSGSHQGKSPSRHEGEARVYRGKWDDTPVQMPNVSG